MVQDNFPDLFQPIDKQEQDERWISDRELGIKALFDLLGEEARSPTRSENELMQFLYHIKLEALSKFNLSGTSFTNEFWGWRTSPMAPYLPPRLLGAVDVVWGTNTMTSPGDANEAVEDFPDLFQPADDAELAKRNVRYTGWILVDKKTRMHNGTVKVSSERPGTEIKGYVDPILPFQRSLDAELYGWTLKTPQWVMAIVFYADDIHGRAWDKTKYIVNDRGFSQKVKLSEVWKAVVIGLAGGTQGNRFATEAVDPNVFQPIGDEEKEERWGFNSEAGRIKRYITMVSDVLNATENMYLDDEEAIRDLHSVANLIRREGISLTKFANKLEDHNRAAVDNPDWSIYQQDLIDTVFYQYRIQNEAIDPSMFKPASEEELDTRPITYDMVMYAISDYVVKNKLTKGKYQNKYKVKKKHFLGWLRKEFGRWPDGFTKRVLHIADTQWDLKMVESVDPDLFQPLDPDEVRDRFQGSREERFTEIVNRLKNVIRAALDDDLKRGIVDIHLDTFNRWFDPQDSPELERRVEAAIGGTIDWSKKNVNLLNSVFGWHLGSDIANEAVDPDLFKPITREEEKERGFPEGYPATLTLKVPLWVGPHAFTDEVQAGQEPHFMVGDVLNFVEKTNATGGAAIYIHRRHYASGENYQVMLWMHQIKTEWFEFSDEIAEAIDPSLFQPVDDDEMKVRRDARDVEKQAAKFGGDILDTYWRELNQPKDEDMDVKTLTPYFSDTVWAMKQENFDAQLAVDWIYAYREDTGLYYSSAFEKVLEWIVKFNHMHLRQLGFMVDEAKEFPDIFQPISGEEARTRGVSQGFVLMNNRGRIGGIPATTIPGEVVDAHPKTIVVYSSMYDAQKVADNRLTGHMVFLVDFSLSDLQGELWGSRVKTRDRELGGMHYSFLVSRVFSVTIKDVGIDEAKEHFPNIFKEV